MIRTRDNSGRRSRIEKEKGSFRTRTILSGAEVYKLIEFIKNDSGVYHISDVGLLEND